MPADDNAAKLSSPAQQTGNPPKKASFGKGVMFSAVCIGCAYSFDLLGPGSRYPIEVEYEIIKTCVDGGDRPLFRDTYLAKQELCFCALEETMKKLPYKKFRKNTSSFGLTFRQSVAACKDRGRS